MIVQPIAIHDPLHFSEDEKALPVPRALFAKIIAIFRTLAFVIQYGVVWASIFCRHWSWLSSPIPANDLKVSSRNIATLRAFAKCLKTSLYPISKEEYSGIGQSAGLRLTEDLIYRPASGLCLGSSLAFLSQVMSVDSNDESVFLSAAQSVREELDETVVKLQAVYDALIGANVKVPQQDINLFRQILQGNAPSPGIENEELSSLAVSIELFLKLENPPQTFRQFILDDLENSGAEITSSLYALILELDVFWHMQEHPGENKYLSVHAAIIQTVAHLVGLEIHQGARYEGEIAFVSEQLASLDEGGYLLQFKDHTVVLVKTSDLMALFDPSEGLGLVIHEDQDEALSHLLSFYGSNGLASVKALKVQGEGENSDDE